MCGFDKILQKVCIDCIVIVGVRVPLNIGAGVELMFELLCYFDLYSPIDWI